MANKVFLSGRATRDAETRYTQDNKAVSRFTLAVDRFSKEKEADFISCVAFGKTAEFAEQYVKKGKKFIVCGRIQTGSYTNKDGVRVYTTDVIAENVEFCESKNESNNTSAPAAPDFGDGFMNIPEDICEEIPFGN